MERAEIKLKEILCQVSAAKWFFEQSSEIGMKKKVVLLCSDIEKDINGFLEPKRQSKSKFIHLSNLRGGKHCGGRSGKEGVVPFNTFKEQYETKSSSLCKQCVDIYLRKIKVGVK